MAVPVESGSVVVDAAGAGDVENDCSSSEIRGSGAVAVNVSFESKVTVDHIIVVFCGLGAVESTD